MLKTKRQAALTAPQKIMRITMLKCDAEGKAEGKGNGNAQGNIKGTAKGKRKANERQR